jgi:hypothetical protein
VFGEREEERFHLSFTKKMWKMGEGEKGEGGRVEK